MRLLFDAHHLGQNQTGNETWARNVLRRLPAHLAGDDLQVAVSAAGFEQARAMVGEAAVRYVSDSSLRRVALDLPLMAHRMHADVVFTQYQLALSRTPACVLIHDISAELPASKDWLPVRSRLRYRASFRSSARWARRLLTVSAFTRDAMVEAYGLDPDSVVVAPNAVDPGLAALLAADVGRPVVPGLVLAVGNVLPRKNLGVLATAVRALVDEGLDLRLRVVGTVPPAGEADRSALEALLGERLEMTGYVSQQELARHYQEAEVLGFPSRYEGFGIPVLEAMAAGTPVVISSASALPEVAGGAALVAGPDEVNAWVAALRRVLTDPANRAELVAAGRQRVTAFDWDRTAGLVAGALRAAGRQG